ncbi:MFS transporter [Paenarthrobacter aurescens]|uniref:MFS transporter n=1 Tax=Paenarthrobacter aurescens TaxID=43663 RepID=A0A4Y3NGM5_PAEAU|nr:MFS transporter [Paenarthrobacter aurescens]MDO6143400.1 MFS transporter [Paenarthrobacter aurescens]MDO6147248.1 MFS transporter [Paenarthrobacter aurescens]MDO6158492.1 MFS transporter [Paenarthrobacter aurescens]MDO6162475.1 MFS transporter [Paenarthrobacter aurescens]GEB18218.1 MFS transporter [Paenarthrobacter aurescens]
MAQDSSSATQEVTGGLARYVLAATLARSSDGGAVVAIVLLATTSGASGWLAGILGACITAPHLLGPLVARSLDTAKDGRTVIAWACVIHGVTLAAAVLLFPVTPPLVPGLLLIASGLVGPLLTGGISSRLTAIAGPDRTSQRRAQGWDVATYGIGGTIGPSLVAAVSAWVNPATAALILSGATFGAAAVVRLLPYAPPATVAAEVPRPGRTLLMMVSSGPLRRTLYMTVVVALSVASLPITAVASTGELGVVPAAAGVMTAVYGLGGLLGSAGVMIRPLRTDADPLMTWLAAAVGIALCGAAIARTFPTAIAAFAIAGVLNSYFFASTLAARSEYSPPGARGQVFVWIGALKITAGSAGTALAGAFIAPAAQLPLYLASGLTVVAVVVSVMDRRGERLGGCRRSPRQRLR